MQKRKTANKKSGKNPFLELKPKETSSKDKKTRNFTFLYFVVAFLAIIVINNYMSNSEIKTIPYSEFKQDLAKGQVSDVTISNDSIQGNVKQDDGKVAKFTDRQGGRPGSGQGSAKP